MFSVGGALSGRPLSSRLHASDGRCGKGVARNRALCMPSSAWPKSELTSWARRLSSETERDDGASQSVGGGRGRTANMVGQDASQIEN